MGPQTGDRGMETSWPRWLSHFHREAPATASPGGALEEQQLEVAGGGSAGDVGSGGSENPAAASGAFLGHVPSRDTYWATLAAVSAGEMSEMRRPKRAIVETAASYYSLWSKRGMVKALSFITVGGKDYDLDRGYLDIFNPIISLLLNFSSILFSIAGRFEWIAQRILIWTCRLRAVGPFDVAFLTFFIDFMAPPLPIVN
uniref:Uncharacterized protein n=1 Tax=Micrurus corallinus TaxID=54390 RepID=A0A2D4FTA2_MICCO